MRCPPPSLVPLLVWRRASNPSPDPPLPRPAAVLSARSRQCVSVWCRRLCVAGGCGWRARIDLQASGVDSSVLWVELEREREAEERVACARSWARGREIVEKVRAVIACSSQRERERRGPRRRRVSEARGRAGAAPRRGSSFSPCTPGPVSSRQSALPLNGPFFFQELSCTPYHPPAPRAARLSRRARRNPPRQLFSTQPVAHSLHPGGGAVLRVVRGASLVSTVYPWRAARADPVSPPPPAAPPPRRPCSHARPDSTLAPHLDHACPPALLSACTLRIRLRPTHSMPFVVRPQALSRPSRSALAATTR